MSTKEEYIRGLQWRLDNIKNEVTTLQNKIQELFREVENKQQQAQNIIMLLASEGSNVDDPELMSLTNVAIADLAYDYLSTRENKKSIHYNDLTQFLMSKGVLIPGKNPSANLLSHISRDARFVRTGPGTYGLKEWGLSELPPSRKKKSRKRK